MFRAIGRYLRAIGYLVTGRIDKARQSLDDQSERDAGHLRPGHHATRPDTHPPIQGRRRRDDRSGGEEEGQAEIAHRRNPAARADARPARPPWPRSSWPDTTATSKRSSKTPSTPGARPLSRISARRLQKRSNGSTIWRPTSRRCPRTSAITRSRSRRFSATSRRSRKKSTTRWPT